MSTHRTEPPACPHLPDPGEPLDWRHLNRFGNERGNRFYVAALEYAQSLWLQGLPARAILSLDRALFARVGAQSRAVREWGLPYAALRWMIEQRPQDAFIGNPRVHYQHLADRVRGERMQVRRWRAWAGWAIVRRCWPQLPADPSHSVAEPDERTVQCSLARWGIPGEVAQWQEALTPERRGEVLTIQ